MEEVSCDDKVMKLTTKLVPVQCRGNNHSSPTDTEMKKHS